MSAPSTLGPGRRTIVASAIAHALLLGVLFLLPAQIVRAPRSPKPTEVVFYRPPVERAQPVPPVVRNDPPPKPRPKPKPQTKPAPAPIPPRVEPPPEPVAVAHVEPRPTPPPRPAAPPSPPRPKPQPRVGSFGQAEAVSVSRSAPVRQATPLDSFAAAPAAQKRKVVVRVVEMEGAFDTAEAPPAPRRPAAARGSVMPTGFGEQGSAPEPARAVVPASAVQRGGFGSAVAAEPAVRKTRAPVETPDTPVEIQSKPKPQYTEEARELRIEGEVEVEVTFLATGELRVLRVVRGLGHGLDEAAVDAARKIRFTPARRDGMPVDHTATLRVVFQLG